MPRVREIDDQVELRLGGDTVTIYEDYDVERSILRQPCGFKASLGWGGTARELREKYPAKTPFELLVEGRRVMSGEIDNPEIDGPPTTLKLSGRDTIAKLFDSYIEDEQSFSERTYIDVTKKALAAVGLADRTIEIDNAANRVIQSGIRKTKSGGGQKLIEAFNIDTGENEDIVTGNPNRARLRHETVKAELGSTWWDFLCRQYRLAGIFLWAAADGSLVLSRPDGRQEPSYAIVHARSGPRRLQNNVLKYSWNDDRTNRHARAVVYGRGGGGKQGRKKLRGEFVDLEMAGDGYVNQIVFKDDDLRTNNEGAFAARRMIGEERRSGWRLEYTVSGHTVLDDRGQRVLWTPDTTVQVEDEELGISGKYYIESVRLSRSQQTNATLRLMRPSDLVFAENLFL